MKSAVLRGRLPGSKDAPASGSGPYTSPSRLIEVKLPFYTQSHKVIFHFFFPYSRPFTSRKHRPPQNLAVSPVGYRGKSSEKRKLISGSSPHRRNRREW